MSGKAKLYSDLDWINAATPLLHEYRHELRLERVASEDAGAREYVRQCDELLAQLDALLGSDTESSG